MSRLTTRIWRPGELGPAERAALLDALLPVHRRLFSGIDRDALERYAFEPGTPHRWVLLVQNGTTAVGYCAVHVADREVQGRPLRLLRGGGGVIRGYRRDGSSLLSRFVAARAAWALATARGRPLWFTGAIMNPASYRMVANALGVIHPAADGSSTPDMTRMLNGVADALGMPPSVTGDPGVRRVGWSVDFSADERARIESSDDPADRFFRQRNPHYAEGEGLVFLVPLTARTVARAVGNIGRARIERRLGRGSR